MRLYLVRHSQPEPDGPDDEDDPELSKAGVKIATALGEWMVDKDEVPTRLIVSPTMRTMQTAEVIVKAIEDGGMLPPEVQQDVGIGPHMSIRGAVLRVAQDKSMVRVGIVSHHESIEHGLRVLNLDGSIHHDIFAEGEMRIVRVKRGSGKWKEHRRVPPSDLGYEDAY